MKQGLYASIKELDLIKSSIYLTTVNAIIS